MTKHHIVSEDTLRQVLDALRHGSTEEQKNAAARNLTTILANGPVEPIGEVEQIDIDVEGTASVWFSPCNTVSLGDYLYAIPKED
jgi:hypothetical protein